MINIDKIQMVKVKETLKTSERKWPKGAICYAPLPDDLVKELKADTGVVEIVEWKSELSPPEVKTSAPESDAAKSAETDKTAEELEELKNFASEKLGIDFHPRTGLKRVQEEILRAIYPAVKEKFDIDLEPDISIQDAMAKFIEIEEDLKTFEDV